MRNTPMNDRRHQIIEAAAHVIGEDGIARATTRRIAKKAGVPLASIHHSFGSKATLFESVYEESITLALMHIDRRITPMMGVRPAVELIMRSLSEWIAAVPDEQQREFEFALWSIRSPGSQHMANKVYQRWISHLSGLLQVAHSPHDGFVDTQLIARHVVSAVDGCTWQWLALGDDQFPTMIGYSIAQVLNMIDATS